MKSSESILPLFAALIPAFAPVTGHAAGILSPNDFVIGIDSIRNNPGGISNTGAEGPASAFDGSDSSKWLSFGRSWTGLIVTPAGGASIIQSMSFTAGGDAPERDPVSYQLFGTNGPITSTQDSDGLSDSWTLISSGATGLNGPLLAATARSTTGSLVSFPNSTAFTSYKVVFTALRKANANPFDPVTLANAATPNSVQLSEWRAFDGSSANIFATAPILSLAIDQTDSFSPATERPIEAIDGSKAGTSKYLNFGREGAGLIITPAVGSSTVRGLQLTTANDVEARDPSSYEIWGTNETILSLEDSNGLAEAWTLITTGALSLPAARNAESGIIGFTNETAFLSYKVIFPENKGPDASANSIQFSELELYTVPEPSSLLLLGFTGIALLGIRRHRL
jgi:hypothetical protein